MNGAGGVQEAEERSEVEWEMFNRIDSMLNCVRGIALERA
jgi:hypothetical protein